MWGSAGRAVVEAARGSSSTSLSASSSAGRCWDVSGKPLRGSAPAALGSSGSHHHTGRWDAEVPLGNKPTKKLSGNNCGALAWLARALLSVQTGLGGRTIWRYQPLTRGLGGGQQRKLHLRQSCLQEHVQATWRGLLAQQMITRLPGS